MRRFLPLIRSSYLIVVSSSQPGQPHNPGCLCAAIISVALLSGNTLPGRGRISISGSSNTPAIRPQHPLSPGQTSMRPLGQEAGVRYRLWPLRPSGSLASDIPMLTPPADYADPGRRDPPNLQAWGSLRYLRHGLSPPETPITSFRHRASASRPAGLIRRDSPYSLHRTRRKKPDRDG